MAQRHCVGMATNIPPPICANCDAAILLIERPDATLKEVMKLSRPRIPTGAYIAGAGIEPPTKLGGSFMIRPKRPSKKWQDRENMSSPKFHIRSTKPG